jgi:predicted ATP-dependent serine protease
LVAEEEKLCESLEKYKPHFAVISTLQNLLNGRSWSKPEQMRPVAAAILRLSRSYFPVVLITHSPWDTKQRWAAGTVTQTANFMTTMHYVKKS